MRLWLLLLLWGFTSHEHGVSGSSGSGSGFEMEPDSVSILCPESTQIFSEPTGVPVSPSTSQTFSVFTISTVSTVSLLPAPSTSFAGPQTSIMTSMFPKSSMVSTIQPGASVIESIDATSSIVEPTSAMETISPSPSIEAISTSIEPGTSAVGSIDATSSIIVPTSAMETIAPSPIIGAISTSIEPGTSAVESIDATSSTIVPTSAMETISPSPSIEASLTLQLTSTVPPIQLSTPLPSVTPSIITPSPTPPSIWDQVLNFFRALEDPELAGFIAGGVVVLILSVIVCLCCCCYICNRVRKRRKQRKFNVHDASMTVTNQGVSSIHYSNGTPRLRPPPLNSDSSLRDPAHFELNQNQFDGFGRDATRYEPAQTWDTPLDNERLIGDASVEHDINGTGPSQPHRSQLSIPGDDVFQEGPLPELTPMTYSSQIFNSSSLHQGLSVDDDPMHGGMRRLSLSGEYMQRIPGGSPSLRHPTRMLKSIESEDTKSAQGSRISIPGSKTSMQGSRPSVFSSQASFMQSGSRSQMFLSNDPISSGANNHNHRDDDTLSLPLSGRTTSPLLHQSSLNSSFEVPTRDEPSGRAPFLVTSHNLGADVKDFASMTSIPNILSPELGTVRVPMDLDPKPESKSESVGSRRLSRDLSALTTLSSDKPKSETKKSNEKEAPKKDEETGTPKKGRSRMSRLEMLTSLRASMRKAAKRVSFTKGKKQKENDVVLTNESALSDQETTPTKDNPLRRHSDNSEPSPGDVRGAGRTRAYTDFAAQLSQPNLYYPPMPPHSYHHANNYQQLSQSYGFPYPPVQVPIEDPYRHGGIPRPPPEVTTRYTGMITPDYSDLTTPDHGRYGNQDGVNTPEQYLQHDGSTSDEYPPHDHYPLRSTSPSGVHRAVSPSMSYTSNEERSTSPDHFPPTSESYHRSRSPTHLVPGKPLPTVHERYKFDELPSPDMFPPYNSDTFTSPSRRPLLGDTPDFFLEGGGPHMYPPPPLLYPGAIPNGYPIPPRAEYFEDRRRNSLEHGFNRGSDQMGTFQERRSSFDRTSADHTYHPRQSSYEQPPGDFPHPRPYYNPRREYEQVERDKRRSVMSDASDVSTPSRARVSWNTEVIEYVRTPSDGSDFDLNQL